jgi:hypothetical protein
VTGLRQVGVDDALVRGQHCWRRGHAVRREISGRCTKHELHIAKPSGDQTRVRQIGNAHRQIKSFFHQIDEAVCQHQV